MRLNRFHGGSRLNHAITHLRTLLVDFCQLGLELLLVVVVSPFGIVLACRRSAESEERVGGRDDGKRRHQKHRPRRVQHVRMRATRGAVEEEAVSCLCSLVSTPSIDCWAGSLDEGKSVRGRRKTRHDFQMTSLLEERALSCVSFLWSRKNRGRKWEWRKKNKRRRRVRDGPKWESLNMLIWENE